MEDYSEDCEDDFEVRKRYWIRFTFQQTIDFELGWDVIGIQEDGSDLNDPFYFERIQLLRLPYINRVIQELRNLKELKMVTMENQRSHS